jgi:hypothetical protein
MPSEERARSKALQGLKGFFYCGPILLNVVIFLTLLAAAATVALPQGEC